MCISPVKVYKKHKNKRENIFIKRVYEKKGEKGLKIPSVPIIDGIPYTVPCACASRTTTCTGRQDPGDAARRSGQTEL